MSYLRRKGFSGVKINQESTAIVVTTAEKIFRENYVNQKGYDQQLLNKFYQSINVESMLVHN
jgi:hypothetical protein